MVWAPVASHALAQASTDAPSVDTEIATTSREHLLDLVRSGDENRYTDHFSILPSTFGFLLPNPIPPVGFLTRSLCAESYILSQTFTVDCGRLRKQHAKLAACAKVSTVPLGTVLTALCVECTKQINHTTTTRTMDRKEHQMSINCGAMCTREQHTRIDLTHSYPKAK